ncbi:MAG: sigma-54 dependent transcriptional regulator [Nitrospinota bacterium]|nr:sigma-54 dependent transcriptional regulator [Nitrospinota bacterium]
MAEKERILVVDDDLNTLKMVESFLALKKYQVVTCLTFRDAMKEIDAGEFDAAVIDYFMPNTTGLEMMKAFHATDPDLPVIVLTASRDIKVAVNMIKEGAFNYLIKPVDPDELYVNLDNAFVNRRLKRENKKLKLDLKDRYKFDHIVGDSGRMREVFDLTARASKVRSNALIIGETGVGKELVAKAIHFNSDRCGGPFIGVNCSALAESLLEAELFGIEKNVATGVDARMGKFEAADGGSLFLDEVGDMSPSIQAKVLRAIQEREVERVGSHTPRKVNIRIIAATNRDLEAAVDQETFRKDLFYRLNVLVIPIPPLRLRKQDISPLCDHFLAKFCAENKMEVKNISIEAAKILMSHPWPGNVRELENTMERAVILCDEKTITPTHLPDNLAAASILLEGGADGDDCADLEQMVSKFEKGVILDALEKCAGRQNKAAQMLGVSERSMWYKIKKLGIQISKDS